MQARFCQYCGSPLGEQVKFCGRCGNPVQRPAPVQDDMDNEATVVVNPAPGQEAVSPQKNYFRPEPPIQQEPVHQQPPVSYEAPVRQQPPVSYQEPVRQQPPVSYQEPAYTPPPQPETVARKKQKARAEAPAERRLPGSRRSAGTVILSIFLCVLIFMWTFAAVMIFDIRQTLKADTIVSALSYDQLMKIPASVLGADEDQTAVDVIAGAIENAYGGTIEVTGDTVEEFLDESTFLPFLAEELEEFVADICGGTGDSGITTEELTTILGENAGLLEDIFNEEFNDQSVDFMVDRVEEAGVLDYLDAGNLKDDVPALYYGLKVGLSYWTAGFFLLLSLLFILLLAKGNRWDMIHTCGDTGVTLVVQGCILLAASAVALLLPDVWDMMFGGAAHVGILLSAVLGSGLICAAAVFAAGILLLVIKAISKAIVIRSAAKRV